MHGDLMMLRVACRVVEELEDKRALSPPRTQHQHHPQPTRSAQSAATVSASFVLPSYLPSPLPSTSALAAVTDPRRIPVPLLPLPLPLPAHTAHPDLMATFTSFANPPQTGDDADATKIMLVHQHPHHKRPRLMGESSQQQHHHHHLPSLHIRPTMRLPSMPSPPPSSSSTENALSIPSHDDDNDKSHLRAAPATLVSFLGHKNKRGEARLPSVAAVTEAAEAEATTTSPTRAAPYHENDGDKEQTKRDYTCSSSDGATLSPVGSPVTTSNVHTTVSILRLPGIAQSRQSPPMAMAYTMAPSPPRLPRAAAAQVSLLPSLRCGSPSPPTPAPLHPPRAMTATTATTTTTQPSLKRKRSSQWRQELPEQDRDKTRQRIRRGLHQHCQGDYEKLLLMLCAMEEEVLHVRTTSLDHYEQQSEALQDRIKTLAAPPS